MGLAFIAVYRSLWFFIISLLRPDINYWLIGPDCYYRLIILACKQSYLCFQM